MENLQRRRSTRRALSPGEQRAFSSSVTVVTPGAGPSRHDAGYDLSNNYANLSEVAAPSQELYPDEQAMRVRTSERSARNAAGEARRQSLARTMSHSSRRPSRLSQAGSTYDFPYNYVYLDELAAPSHHGDDAIYSPKSLEQSREQEREYQRDQDEERRKSLAAGEKPKGDGPHRVSRFATQLYVISYLIFFSFFGTLARLGLQAITFYPGAPVVFSELWANFAGSLIMGFLSEDRMLFKEEWGTPVYAQQLEKAKKEPQDEESGSDPEQSVDLEQAKKAHAATKKTIPLYIGLTFGFCGCFTTFSSFIRDSYLAMSNALPTPLNHPADYGVGESMTSTVSRNGGFSFMALLAVIFTTVSVSISALRIGAHLAILLEPWTPSLPFTFCRKFLDRLMVFLAWGCWLGAILLAIWPPDRHRDRPEVWRGRAIFALIFAPLGCLGRFYAAIYLNSKIPSFPLGTFVVNIFGTAIIGMTYDLQHVPMGGVVGCQVLQGIEDGFCGCLTTISTWVSELRSLRRWNAYRYGVATVVVAFCFLVVIMGSLQWTKGFSRLECMHAMQD